MSCEEFKSLLDDFINEIELVFEYIPSELLNMLRNQSENITDQVLDDFYNSLNQFHDVFIQTNQKLSKQVLNAFDNVVLFDILPFDLFKSENKNTKRSLIKHLSNMYLVSNINNVGLTQQTLIQPQQPQPQQQPVNWIGYEQNQQAQIHPQQLQQMGPMSGLFNGGLGDLLKSDALTNIVNNLSNKIRDENIDPTSLLMGMMTGQRNAQQDNLLNYLTETINTTLTNDQQFSNSITNLTNNIQSNPELLNSLNSGNFNPLDLITNQNVNRAENLHKHIDKTLLSLEKKSKK